MRHSSAHHGRRAPTIILVMMLVVGAALAGWSQWQDQQGPKDLAGNSVQADDVPPRNVVDGMKVNADVGTRVLAPAVGLDVPLGELSSYDGEITPPGYTQVYRVRDHGVAPDEAEKGTVFVVTHSVRHGSAPGNLLIDVDTSEAAVSPGDRISVAGVGYRVDGSELVGKSALAEDDGVWADDPGRLVVITCMQNADGSRSTENLVITASLADG